MAAYTYQRRRRGHDMASDVSPPLEGRVDRSDERRGQVVDALFVDGGNSQPVQQPRPMARRPVEAKREVPVRLLHRAATEPAQLAAQGREIRRGFPGGLASEHLGPESQVDMRPSIVLVIIAAFQKVPRALMLDQRFERGGEL
ncbi:hypothetical protein PG985_011355 [Apiospora marii]|uniref:uncharacterized protein n=1 Tax=Apiospora marii TaxID=335849 RepID=UPI003130011B